MCVNASERERERKKERKKESESKSRYRQCLLARLQDINISVQQHGRKRKE